MTKRLIPLVAAAALAAVEIENSVWLLFNFIPVASGSPDHPNLNKCKLFRNTVNLSNNMKVLLSELEQEEVTKVANLTSHYTEESYLFFLLARRACHTSAVLVKSDANDKGKSK